MSKTSIHIEPCKIGSSERHNQRLKYLDYVRPELSRLNESWVGVADLPAHLNDLKTLIKNKTGRAMQAKATPIREGVIVIKQDTTIEQLKGLATAIEQRWGIKTLQIYTHKDEGHTDSEGSWKPNLHAHIVFDWVNHNTGKSIKLSRQDMAEMQTMVADCLEMVRGESSDLQHLGAIQYKTQAEEQRLRTTQEKTMKEEQAREQARAEAKQVTIATSKEIIERNQRKVLGPKWGDAYSQLEEAFEQQGAKLIELEKRDEEQGEWLEEIGIGERYDSFWRDCKEWFKDIGKDIGDKLKDLALWIWIQPKGLIDERGAYTADKKNGRLLIDGQTIEQIRAPKIGVQKTDLHRQAEAIINAQRERKAGQERDTDRHREQERQQRRKPKL